MEIHWGYTMDNNEPSVGSEVPMYKLKQVVSSTLWNFFFRRRYSSVVDPRGHWRWWPLSTSLFNFHPLVGMVKNSREGSPFGRAPFWIRHGLVSILYYTILNLVDVRTYCVHYKVLDLDNTVVPSWGKRIWGKCVVLTAEGIIRVGRWWFWANNIKFNWLDVLKWI